MVNFKNVRVVFFAGAAKEFEEDDHDSDAYTRGCKYSSGGSTPIVRDETGVDRVPIPPHLSDLLVVIQLRGMHAFVSDVVTYRNFAIVAAHIHSAPRF